MDKNKINLKKHELVAISFEGSEYKAACLVGTSAAMKVMWVKNANMNETPFADFAEQCGLSMLPPGGEKSKADAGFVLGYDSTGVIFYRISVPASDPKEVEKIIRIQTEAHLPLAPEKVQIAWEKTDSSKGHLDVTVAAAAKDNLQKFLSRVKGYGPQQIYLDCEGLVKTWLKFYAPSDIDSAIIVSINKYNSHVCLIKSAKLANAAKIDIGLSDFVDESQTHVDGSAVEGFIQDLTGTLEHFDCSQIDSIPIYILSPGAEDAQEDQASREDNLSTTKVINIVVEQIRKMSLPVNVTEFTQPVSKYQVLADSSDCLYQYRIPIGLGMMAMDKKHGLGIFDSLYRTKKEAEKKSQFVSTKAAVVLFAIMVILAAMAVYFTDVWSEAKYSGLTAQGDYQTIAESHRVMKEIAGYRLDPVKLIADINSVQVKGILLSGLDVRRGKQIKVSGYANNNDVLYKFEDGLMAMKDSGISNAKIQSSSEDKKSKKIKFDITFDYKEFSDK